MACISKVEMCLTTPAGDVAHLHILHVETDDLHECGGEFRYDLKEDVIKLAVTTEGLSKYTAAGMFATAAELWDAMQVAKRSGITNEDDLLKYARIEAGYSPALPDDAATKKGRAR